MSFLHVLADFTACQPLGNLRSRSERERERETEEEKKDRESGWKRGEKKEGEGGIGRWAKKRRIVKKRKKKANMDREVLTRALTELSSREIKKKYAWMDGGFSTFIKKKKSV